jgi:hypothetical protein
MSLIRVSLTVAQRAARQTFEDYALEWVDLYMGRKDCRRDYRRATRASTRPRERNFTGTAISERNLAMTTYVGSPT